ncbi:MAG: hypothetical protein K6G55_06840 [Selenomonadaceae bacterium]|nr:hypothetical protein [Selenomonadaceae bacterium]
MTYEEKRYLNYFEIDEGYYPEINESSIKDPKNKWQHTFPHSDIVALMKLLERTLSRSEKKSLWLEGSYGTGKSRIVWMLQNLLSCPENEFDAYFDEYDTLRDETDLRERLRTIRKGKIVTAKRYATGDITSTQKLIFAVFESLTAALKKNGYKFDGAKTLRGKIVDWLESDKANLEMFRAKIQKPEYRMSSTLASRTAEEIIERLKNPNAVVSQLVEDILKLGEREGIRAFNIDMKDLTDWITEVIEENRLTAMVLFWDEFSKFFANNRNNLDEFQRLAELSNIIPFYLVIATHQVDKLDGASEQSFRVVSDRFSSIAITMPDNIALNLIGHALKIKNVAQNEWHYISSALKERTAEPRKVVMDFAKIRDEKILTDILPIHPMTAILLKNLASYFASNQRSIFNFIKNTDPNIKAFQDFIATKSPQNGDLLTIDYLWNFFYENGTDEHGNNVGKMNLRPSIRVILDSYPMNKNDLNPDEQTVLKTVLLFQAIDQETRNEVSIFHPTEKNIELAFTGVNDMENGRAVTILNNLVRKNILFKKPGDIETFAAMAVSGDLAELERLKAITRAGFKTATHVDKELLISGTDINSAIIARYEFINLSAENFTRTINRITNEAETYKIKVIVCCAYNEDEQNKIYNLITAAIRDERYHKLVFIDASSNLITRDVLNSWVENSANEQYWRGKDDALADKMKQNADTALNLWIKSFADTSFVYYPATKNSDEVRKGISCQNSALVVDELKDNVRKIYPYSFDNAGVTNTLFMSSQLRKLAEAGIKQEEYSMLKAKDIKLVLGDLWHVSGKYWELYPDLMLSRLKVEIDTLIKTELEKNIRISFKTIFDYLLERGFMPLNIHAFLTGFLLKEYACDPYRFSAGKDGDIGGALNTEKLAEYIAESIKQSITPMRNYRPKYLEIMSPNQRQFMSFASEIFNVNEDISVEHSAQKLRLQLKKLGYPLWCYVDVAEDKYRDFLLLLKEIANSKLDVSVSALAERAGQILTNNPAAFGDMKNFLTAENGQKIFTEFLQNFEGGIIFELANQIGITNPVSECQNRITSGDSIWLHDKDAAEDDLKKLIIDYKIVIESKKFGIESKSFSECVYAWQDWCGFNLKIPSNLIIDRYPETKNFFLILKEMVELKELPQSKREKFLNQLSKNSEAIKNAIANRQNILRDKHDNSYNLSDEELNNLYTSLPSNSFIMSQGDYYRKVSTQLKSMESGRRKSKLARLWNKISGTSPREWSKIHRTPILALVPKNELDNAQKVFNTIMANSPEDKDLNFSIKYLEDKPQYFDLLNDENAIETAFRERIIGDEFRGFLDNNDEIRDELEDKFQGDIYQWYPSIQSQEIIKKFAERKYYTSETNEKIKETVTRMSDREAKNLLINLLDSNYEVGIKLLRESLN